MNSIKARIIENNAEWCASIWKAHNLSVIKEKNYWFCSEKVPDYYPNIVTLAPNTDAQIAQLLQSEACKKIPSISIKDSFSDLILSESNMHPLFNAKWIYKEQHDNKPEGMSFNWRQIKTERDLLHWEESWDNRPSGAKRIFLNSLLSNRLVEIWAGYDREDLVCGYIANKSVSLIGLSNIFGDYKACITHATLQYATYDLVGYENDDDLEIAKSLGFEALDNLTIWVSAS